MINRRLNYFRCVLDLMIDYTTKMLIYVTPNHNSHCITFPLVALKNCEVVSVKALPAEQLEAYLSLRQQEQKIQLLDLPIQNFC